MIAPPLIAAIILNVHWLGLASWRWVFFITGSLGVLWCAGWLWLSHPPAGVPAAAAAARPVPIRELLRFRETWGVIENSLGQPDPTNHPRSPVFEPRFRLSADPTLGFGVCVEPANVLSLAARMPCEHIPFIPQLLSDYRRGRPGHRALKRSCPVASAEGCAGSCWPENQRRPEPLRRTSRLAIITKDMHRQLTRKSSNHAIPTGG